MPAGSSRQPEAGSAHLRSWAALCGRLVRRVIVTAATCLLCVSAAAWIASYWQIEYSTKSGAVYALECGAVFASNSGSSVTPGWSCKSIDLAALSRTRLWPSYHFLHYYRDWSRWRYRVEFPLWIPLAAGLSPLCIQRLIRALPKRRTRQSVCRRCRYDLSGLPVGAKCPECGTPSE